ncbi:segregation/condensation protein A [Jeotgalibacillus haloalkalitolerans]|uniref:Segregation and condensation protein A n=1 Tax=Jeotgalibacillus haloalkalitolerans TaxID=3104292 RepID=A0ABU5KMW2_9BACL|nr:segregation/condensation protein A [Jeotgalibacillus sp. HH7-29]MDZ5712050.1 segregation/condensation protein A [Jeotgalibacillus sp. HH7-29]
MEYTVKLDAFEGPLDLLLHLIQGLEIDIYDIPMAEISEQYTLYIKAMSVLELNTASEYLVMAATLMSIKSRMLLPKQEEHWEEDQDFEEDPREELVEKLIEYRKYKKAATDLKEKETERSMYFTKPPEDLTSYSQPVDSGEKTQIDLHDLIGAFNKLMRRKKIKQPMSTRITRQEISIEKRMSEILETIRSHRSPKPFSALFPVAEKPHMVVSFLAVLELVKRQEIHIKQDHNFSEIMVESIEGVSLVGQV